MAGQIRGPSRGTLVTAFVAAAVLVTAAVVAVTARSGGGAAQAGLVARSTPSTTLSMTPSRSTGRVPAPVLPDAARARTPRGAEEFFRHFLRLYAYSYNTLDTGPIGAVSDPRCAFCASVEENVRAAAAAGRTVQAPPVTVRTLVVAPGDPARGLVVNAVISQARVVTREADGSVAGTSTPGDRVRVDARVVWTSGRWVVRAVDVVEPGT